MTVCSLGCTHVCLRPGMCAATVPPPKGRVADGPFYIGEPERVALAVQLQTQFPGLTVAQAIGVVEVLIEVLREGQK